MTNSALFPAIAFVGLTVFLFYRAVYWQERRAGRSHEASSKESAVLGGFLLGSAVVEYVAVIADYV